MTTVWTGARLLVLGGIHTDTLVDPCPPAAACSGPPSTTLRDGASWDPTSGAWQLLPRAPVAVPGTMLWTGATAIGLSASLDPATGLWSSVPDLGPALIYDAPLWTGHELVGIGWIGSDVVAEALDPVTGARRSVPWPHGDPGAASIRSIWTGTDVVAFVAVTTASGGIATRVVAWNPTTGRWRDLLADVPGPRAVDGDGHDVVWLTDDDHLSMLDPATAARSSIALPRGADPTQLSVGPAGQVLIAGQDQYWLRRSDGRWHLLPSLPATASSVNRTLAWAGDDLVVWGGRATGEAGDHSVNTARGWALHVPAPDPSGYSGPMTATITYPELGYRLDPPGHGVSPVISPAQARELCERDAPCDEGTPAMTLASVSDLEAGRVASNGSGPLEHRLAYVMTWRDVPCSPAGPVDPTGPALYRCIDLVVVDARSGHDLAGASTNAPSG